MAIGIIYNNENVVIEANLNADSLDWSVKPNSIVFHDGNSTDETREYLFNLLKTVPIKYLKIVDSNVVEMNSDEKLAVDAAEAFAIESKQREEMRNVGPTLLDIKSPDYAVIRAIIIELIEQTNNERTNFNSLLTWLGAQGGLTSRTQLPNFQLNTLTAKQALTAIKNRISVGDADKIQ